jgi:DNA-binding MurR/RpiR family transcriptional regulator
MLSDHSKDTVATALHALGATLPPGERRVARVLLDGYPVVGIGTLAELAERAKVSSPTVLRLVNRLGFAAFGEFQRALRLEVEARLATTASSFPPEPPAGDEHLVISLLHDVAESISADARSVICSEIDQVVDLLAVRSRCVATMGGWLTQVFAQYFFAQLQLMRPGCICVGSSVSSGSSELVDLGRRDTLVVFDVRPYAVATEQLCVWVRRRGVRIILFTDAWLSPVSKQASYVLVARSASASAFDSYAPLFATAEAILAAAAAQLGESAHRRMARAEELLEGWAWRPDEPASGRR